MILFCLAGLHYVVGTVVSVTIFDVATVVGILAVIVVLFLLITTSAFTIDVHPAHCVIGAAKSSLMRIPSYLSLLIETSVLAFQTTYVAFHLFCSRP